ncbi:MAG TPA: hydrogenase maturation protease [Verrucomicrobia bacterium]|nr:hydrogenase maturation protease [Verrucomicrobiota bacterium]HOP97652.1 hydrogenase maturation protease [Verrucomicrobiota bacterium]HPU55049.1 hydrogenase maturation protease [Verrucomicrobiota bacterium]
MKPSNLLVIGYGNTLRGDDAVGVRVAEAIEALTIPGVRVIVAHQLTPELAQPLSETKQAVFVDAALTAETEVSLKPIEPAAGAQIMAHTANPGALLALARELFGRCPAAWWLTIPIEDVGFSESLSPKASKGLKEAVERIRSLAGGF